MKFILINILIAINLSTTAQQIDLFSILPLELRGDNGAGVLVKVASDSQNIFVMGHVPKVIPGVSNKAHAITASLDYSGNVKRADLIIDSSVGTNPYHNGPLIRKNDSIYFALFNIHSPYSPNGAKELFEINLRTGYILKRKLFYDISELTFIQIFAVSELKDNLFQIIIRNDAVKPDIHTIYEMDTTLNVRRIITIPYALEDLVIFRWISRDSLGNYELILETDVRKNKKYTGVGYLSYLKIDSSGQLIKKKDLPTVRNLSMYNSGETYSIIQNTDRSFIIACNEREADPNKFQEAPFIIKTSPEFDSIIWSTKFYEYAQIQEEPRYSLNYMCRMNNGSGFVACGDIGTSLFEQPDYGILFKVSTSGDSLWLRKYQPISWDSIRASQIQFKQLICTPYNTIAVSAYVGDRQSGWIHPWVLHLDSDGCIIPGCNKVVINIDINSGKEKAFVIYPNPTNTDHIYLQSRISSSQDYHLGIYNLQGQELKVTVFRPQEGVQYIVDLPQEIPNGEYLLRINGKEFNQTEKLIIAK